MKGLRTHPLTLHRHAGLDPASRKLLKPLDSGLRRNDEKVLFSAMLSAGQVLGFPKHSANHIKNKKKLTGRPWKGLVLIMVLALLSLPLWAADEAEKEKSWWEKRHQRTDIFYPHDAHQAVMEEDGDACLRCHPFNGTDIRDIKRLQVINVIANEPLREICHSCHVMHGTKNTGLIIDRSDKGASQLMVAFSQRVWPVVIREGDFSQLCVLCHAMETLLEQGDVDVGNGLRGVHRVGEDCRPCHRHGEAAQAGM